MVAAKSEYRNRGVIVYVMDKTLVQRGMSQRIILDSATQNELNYLLKIGNPCVEVVEKKKDKGV